MYIAKEAFLTLIFYKRAGVFSIMRRQFVPCPSECAASVGDLLAELRDFTDQRVDLLLLANDDLVQLVEQVFIEAGLDLQVGQAMVDDVGRLHAAIGHVLAEGSSRHRPAPTWIRRHAHLPVLSAGPLALWKRPAQATQAAGEDRRHSAID